MTNKINASAGIVVATGIAAGPSTSDIRSIKITGTTAAG